MNIDDEFLAVNVEITKIKAVLLNKLEHKKQLMLRQAESIGCKCGVIILDADARRLVNIYCPVHSRGTEK